MWMMPLHLHINQKSDYDDDHPCSCNMGKFSHNLVWTFIYIPTVSDSARLEFWGVIDGTLLEVIDKFRGIECIISNFFLMFVLIN